MLSPSQRLQPTARATGGYYDVLYDCDDAYFETIYNCTNPDWNQCRANAYSAYSNCVYNARLTHQMPDFCDSARQEYYSHCLLEYGPEGWSPDPDAWSTCRAASGIDQCE
ncbi:MAG: hypothetical protein JOZ96_21485 [Acidobacteria bacterium]|nr:hypothetical protein [Acidobacteriota bacterium]